MFRKAALKLTNRRPKAGLRCGECGATVARNGNPFTANTLKVHQARMHEGKRAKGEPLPHGLTRSQYEVMKRLVTGRTKRTVAEQLGVSFHTVSEHVRKSYRKLGVKNRAEAVRKWLEQKNGPARLVQPPFPPMEPLALRYCPGCGCHLELVRAAIRAG